MTLNQAMRAALAVLFAAAILLPAAARAQGPPEDRGRPAEVEEKIQERRAATQARIEEKRSNAQEKSQEKRQAACEKRSEKLNAMTNRLSLRADKHADVMDRFFERVQKFYDSGQLTDPNYDELEAAALEAQEAARTEVDVLEELNVEVDCENPDVVASVGAFRTSTSATREALKEYRRALVDLISSLRAEAAEENAGGSGEEESGSETETETETETQDGNESAESGTSGTDSEGSETEEATQ